MRVGPWRVAGAGGAVLICLTVPVLAARQAVVEPPVAVLLARTAEYLAGFAKAYAQVVAEEHYTQTLRPKRTALALTRADTRVIDADVVAVSDSTRTWLNFRDVFAVDQTPVRDRDERLTKLFLAAPGTTVDPAADPLSRAREIADEGARFNLGTLSRNVNFPAMALNYLAPDRVSGLRFRRERRERVAGVDTVVLAFTEVARPTVVRSRERDVPARGQLWIEPATGRVMKTRLVFDEKDFAGESTVTYGYAEKLALWVPFTMVDQVSDARDVIAGRARYENFRRFGTSAVIK